MKVIAFMGSPRKEGNTDILVDTILEGAREAGAETEKVHVYGLKMQGCIHCGACKRDSETCVLKDDFSPLYEKIQASDAVVFASPVYMGRITGALKTLFDRWYAFVDAGFKTRLRPDKKVASVTVYAAPKGSFDGEENYVLEWCERWGMKPSGAMCVPEVAEKGDIRKHEGVLEEARKLGRTLAG